MNEFIKTPILSLRVYEITSPRCKPVAVKGRPFYALTYREQGRVSIAAGEMLLHSTSGCITLTPKQLGYTTEVLQDTKMIAVHFDCEDAPAFARPFVLEDAAPRLRQLFEECLKTYRADGSNLESYGSFYRLLAELEKLLLESREGKIHPAVRQAKCDIEEKFSDAQFNIDALVAALPISASYLRREFRRAYSVTPVEYLRHVRQQKAVSLLSSGYYSVEELARLCGYGSASYFIQSFRSSTGYSPLQYKEKFL